MFYLRKMKGKCLNKLKEGYINRVMNIKDTCKGMIGIGEVWFFLLCRNMMQVLVPKWLVHCMCLIANTMIFDMANHNTRTESEL